MTDTVIPHSKYFFKEANLFIRVSLVSFMLHSRSKSDTSECGSNRETRKMCALCNFDPLPSFHLFHALSRVYRSKTHSTRYGDRHWKADLLFSQLPFRCMVLPPLPMIRSLLSLTTLKTTISRLLSPLWRMASMRVKQFHSDGHPIR